MSQPKDKFDDKLSQLYKNHKSSSTLSIDEKKLLGRTEKPINKFNWINTFQISLTAVALFTLFTLFFNQEEYINQIDEVVYSPTNALIEVHYVEENTYHKKIKTIAQNSESLLALKQANEKRVQSQSNLKKYHEFKGVLVNKADNWYIESCNKDILVQVNASLLQQLQRNNALDNNISQGDLLAFKHNNNGEIIALIKTDNLQQCQG